MRDSPHPHIRRLLAGIAISFLSVIVPACGADSTTAPQPVSAAGTWDLTTVNGQKLPYTLQANDPRQELLSKRYVITAAGTFTYAFSVRTTELDGSVTTTNGTDAGTQTLSANLITLRLNGDGSTLIAVVDGDTLTIVTGTLTQVFTRQ